MTIAIMCTMSASFLLSITNHIDKFLLNNYAQTSNVKALLIFSTLIAGILLSPFWFMLNNFKLNFDLTIFSIALLAAIFFTLSSYFYFKALEVIDASNVVALFQIIPLFSSMLTFIFFHEVLKLHEILGILIIIISTIIMSLKKVNGLLNFKPLIYMFLVTFFSSVYYFTLEISMNLSNYYTSILFFQVSLFFIGLVLICFKDYRNSFFNLLDKGKKVLGFNLINESFTLIANMLNNFANTLIPLAIVNSLTSFQVVFTFLIGVIGVRFSSFFKEDVTKKILVKKIICIICELIGVFIMTY